MYNKFVKWLSGKPQVKTTDDSSCCRELLQLAVKDLQVLVKKQKQRLVVFFVEHISAPAHIKAFSYRQLDAEEEVRPKLVLQSTTVLLTYQGDWV